MKNILKFVLLSTLVLTSSAKAGEVLKLKTNLWFVDCVYLSGTIKCDFRNPEHELEDIAINLDDTADGDLYGRWDISKIHHGIKFDGSIEASRAENASNYTLKVTLVTYDGEDPAGKVSTKMYTVPLTGPDSYFDLGGIKYRQENTVSTPHLMFGDGIPGMGQY